MSSDSSWRFWQKPWHLRNSIWLEMGASRRLTRLSRAWAEKSAESGPCPLSAGLKWVFVSKASTNRGRGRHLCSFVAGRGALGESRVNPDLLPLCSRNAVFGAVPLGSYPQRKPGLGKCLACRMGCESSPGAPGPRWAWMPLAAQGRQQALNRKALSTGHPSEHTP